MTTSADEARLEQIPTSKIDRNPDNPRLVFRPGDLDELLESIRTYGIQVPVSVYKSGGRYVLIDGERRWRCALKLNRRTIPAIIQEKPSALNNLLLMFNIHALREQWDLLTIALKLPRITDLLAAELGKEPNEPELAAKTGLTRAIIRRCKLLMNLPQHHKDSILAELQKPKTRQRFTEDFFIEMERALRTVERALPEVIPNKENVRAVLISKFQTGIINNRVLFRNIAKIARAEKVDVDRRVAANELRKLFQHNRYTIEQAYTNSVGEAYRDRDLGTRIDAVLSLLDDLDLDEIESETREKLEDLGSKPNKCVEQGIG